MRKRAPGLALDVVPEWPDRLGQAGRPAFTRNQ